jgi:hypothetical protein
LCIHHDATTQDILRMYQDEVSSMFVTEQVRSALTLDPFQHLKENIPPKCLERIINSMRVVSHHSVKTTEGYVRTEAIVALTRQDVTVNSSTQDALKITPNKNCTDKFNKKRPRTHPSDSIGGINLHFTYIRTSMTSIHPCTVSYTIDLCHSAAPNETHDYRPKPLLWIHIYAAGVVPASHDTSLAININDDDDQWSDIDDDEESVQSDDKQSMLSLSKAQHVSTSSGAAVTKSSTIASSAIHNAGLDITKNIEHGENSNSNNQKLDRYEAGMDPDNVALLVSHLIVMSTVSSENEDHLAGLGDITIFFLLMTFPFYEHEWDLVGFLLQAVFDNDNGSDGSDEE